MRELRLIVLRTGTGALVWLLLAAVGVVGAARLEVPWAYGIAVGLFCLLLMLTSYRVWATDRHPRLVALSTAVLAASVLVGIPWWQLDARIGPSIWAATGPSPWAAYRVGDFVYVAGSRSFTVLDAASGLYVGAYEVDNTEKRLADNGWMTFASRQDHRVRVFDPARGEILAVTADRVEAVGAGIVVTATCSNSANSSEACAYRGYQPGSAPTAPRLLWTAQGYSADVTAAVHRAKLGQDTIDRLPAVPVWLTNSANAATPDSLVIASISTGRAQYRTARAGTTVTVIGDLVALVRGRPGCTITAVQGNRIRWTAPLPPGCHPSDTLAVGNYLYVQAGGSVDGFAYDLGTGLRGFLGQLSWFTPGEVSRAQAAHAGPRVVVDRDRNRLRGIEPLTGKTLWRFDADGGRLAGIETDSGAVVVLSEGGLRNPLRSAQTRDAQQVVTVLDDRTGKVCARRVIERLWFVDPVGPGRALVGTRSGRYVLVGCLRTA